LEKGENWNPESLEDFPGWSEQKKKTGIVVGLGRGEGVGNSRKGNDRKGGKPGKKNIGPGDWDMHLGRRLARKANVQHPGRELGPSLPIVRQS